MESGARTQLANVICATLIIISLFTLTDALEYIPNATLGSIIFVSILNMFDYERIIKLYKAGERLQAVVTLVTMLCVILLGVSQGLVLGVFCSYAAHLYRDSLPRVYPLGLSTLVGRDGTAFLHFTELSHSHSEWTNSGVDIDFTSSSLKQEKGQGQRQDVPRAVPGMIIAGIDSDNMYFGNARHIQQQLKGMAKTWRSSYLHDPASTSVFSEVSRHMIQRLSSKARKVLIVDISGTMHIDERSVTTFTELKKKMAKNNVIMALVHSGWPDDLATEQECVKGLENQSPHQRERLTRHLLIQKQLEAAGFATILSVNKERQSAFGNDIKTGAVKAEKGQASGVTLFSSLERAVRYFSVSMLVDCVHLSMEYADNDFEGEEDEEGKRQKESPLRKMFRLEREREQTKEADAADADAEVEVPYDAGLNRRPSSFSGGLSDAVRERLSSITLEPVNLETPGRGHGQGQPEVESPIHQHGATANDSAEGGVKI